ncbi:MAG TPA: bifunctional DNA-formamidopyrimidine glycosylase/DNA-(apurinic or apyrimidinic site) lyase [Rhizobiales bacterium]|nr:bifunctional DNA-formamidopyrimidine glycosylase/DNA-(apurinic or apyrimidinic site) lyase [Hyphomicrobiales bacterium]
MPELPEVETVRRGLEQALAGATLEEVRLYRQKLRFALPPDFAAFLQGARFGAFRRRGKYLVIELENKGYLLAHLGMSGRFTVYPPGTGPGERGPHDHIIFLMRNGARLVYTDPRRFGIMDLIRGEDWQEHRLLASLGIEPLGNAMNAAFLSRAARDRRSPLKSFLLDQRIIAGLGNIYVCEALYRARLSPRRLALTLGRGARPGLRAERLTLSIKSVLDDAIAAGGSSLRDYAQSDGELGYFQHRFAVYGREGEPCLTKGCTARISRITQSGRSSFFCPRCQR